MVTSDRRRRVAVTLLLVNVSLIVLVALWRHAGAEAPELREAGQSEPPAAGAPQVEATSPETPPEAAPAATPAAAPSPTPSVTAEASPANDPVMEELRKVVRDPQNGLDIPRLDESSPLAPRGAATLGLESTLGLERRMTTVHALSTAALALIHEARGLADAGRQAESTAMLQHAAKLRDMIAGLAASEGQP